MGITMNSTDSDSLAVQIQIPKSKKLKGIREEVLDTILITFTAV